MPEKISRRKMLQVTAGAAGAAAGSHWIFKLTAGGRIVKAVSDDNTPWKPVILSKRQAEQLAAVCEAIIPQTDTPGARAARVHEFIDLSLSIESEASRERFIEGLEWTDKHCKRVTGKRLHKASDAEVAQALEPLSDAHADHPDGLRPGANFFSDVKTRTIFAYYTSRDGWVEELGRPEQVGMEQWTGCTHSDGAHG